LGALEVDAPGGPPLKPGQQQQQRRLALIEGPATAMRVPAAMRKSTPRSTGTCRVPMA
jgi:hypothetical protein